MNTDHAKTIAEWAKHWPFKRASPELVRRAQAAQRDQSRRTTTSPPAPL